MAFLAALFPVSAPHLDLILICTVQLLDLISCLQVPPHHPPCISHAPVQATAVVGTVLI